MSAERQANGGEPTRGVPFRDGEVRAFTAAEIADVLATAREAIREAADVDEGRAAATVVVTLCMSHESLRTSLAAAQREIARLEQRSAEGHAAHAVSFGALVSIAMLLNLDDVDDYNDVVKAVESAQRELDTLRTDKKRLDWICAHGWDGRFSIELTAERGKRYEIVMKREAIDNAMREDAARSSAAVPPEEK